MSRALALVENDESRKKESAQSLHHGPLLETKLYAPRTQASLVARARLVEAIREGTNRKLTVVVAPAGFGKTTLLASWLADAARADHPAAWVSLDPGDNDPQLFWSYVIRALQRVLPSVGVTVQTDLQASTQRSMNQLLTTLINEIDSLDRHVTLVLDDYHVIDAEPVHASMTFLLDHLPPRMHVVIASRADPAVALPRLRARGELAEVRVADLRFTDTETREFLSRVMSLDVSASDAAILGDRTEGWIAGLKLAALSLKHGSEVRAFVDAFSGDNRYIADYLVEEVLRTEPAHVRRFLLGTAMLDRLSASLCDAVLDDSGTQEMLDDLERRSLFVVALDDRREWFRYHHLFADVLLKQSVAKDPHAARAFHGRASAWFEAHGQHSIAVRHALEAGDVERAAALLERAWPEKNRSYESRAWLERVKSLPQDIVRPRPLLSMGYAWALLNNGELEAAEPPLRDVERWLETANDDERATTLRKERASARVYLAQSLGDVPGTLEHAQRALAMVPDGDLHARATGTALVALAYWGRGELDAAHRTFSEALERMRGCGAELDAIRGIFVLGDIRASQGRLRDAAAIYDEGLREGRSRTFASLPETDELFLGLSEVHREWNDLASATTYLEMMSAASEHSVHKGNRVRWCTAMASVHAAQGHFDVALRLLIEAEGDVRRDPLPRLRPIPAMKARLLLAEGKREPAREWARAANLSANDDVSYLREFELITYARVLVADRAPAAIQLLERLALAARTGGRLGSVIELLVLQAALQQASGNMRHALDSLFEAVTLAEPEGYMRVFVDEGAPMRELLRHATARGLAGEYTRTVLAGFEAPKPRPAVAKATPETMSSGAMTPAPATQALTAREMEILRLIAAGMRNQAIADHLSISAATVKRHIANAYGKLGVEHRTEALVRAKELGLL